MLTLSQIFGKETVAGVDIGSRMIKVVQAEPGARFGQWRITGAGVAPTPDEAVRDGIVVDVPAVAQTIKDIMLGAGITATGAVAAVSGSSIIVRHIRLPKMPESALRKSVRFEAGKYISTSVEGSQIEFEITGPIPGEADKMGVMLVAAPNDMVESRVNALTLAGLEPTAIDLEAFALQRALLDLSPTRPGEGAIIAILDIGAVSTDVNIVTDGRFALTRNIAIAGDNFTTAMKSVSQSTDWNELETLKRGVDMSALLRSDADPEETRIAAAIQPVMDELLREVRRSMNYYHSQLSDPANSNLPAGLSVEAGDTVSKIVITGGSSNMTGIEAYMRARLGVDVEVWNVFENPAYDVSAFPPGFSGENHALFGTCFGLALKEIAEPAAIRGAGYKQTASLAA